MDNSLTSACIIAVKHRPGPRRNAAPYPVSARDARSTAVRARSWARRQDKCMRLHLAIWRYAYNVHTPDMGSPSPPVLAEVPSRAPSLPAA